MKINKNEVIEEFKRQSSDTGSPEVQISIFTRRINNLTDHSKVYKKDFQSKRSLMRLVHKRRKLLTYLKRESMERYTSLIKRLGIRK